MIKVEDGKCTIVGTGKGLMNELAGLVAHMINMMKESDPPEIREYTMERVLKAIETGLNQSLPYKVRIRKTEEAPKKKPEESAQGSSETADQEDTADKDGHVISFDEFVDNLKLLNRLLAAESEEQEQAILEEAVLRSKKETTNKSRKGTEVDDE